MTNAEHYERYTKPLVETISKFSKEQKEEIKDLLAKIKNKN